MNYWKNFCEKIKPWLSSNRGSQNKLSKDLGISRQYASNLVNGKNIPSYELGKQIEFWFYENSGSWDRIKKEICKTSKTKNFNS